VWKNLNKYPKDVEKPLQSLEAYILVKGIRTNTRKSQ
jgi:hypothetical protein